MIPTKVYYTGLEFRPEAVADRWHRGIIPANWSRIRFPVPDVANNKSPINKLNRWLYNNIEGRWAVWVRYHSFTHREINLALELETDDMLFKLGDGRIHAFKE